MVSLVRRFGVTTNSWGSGVFAVRRYPDRDMLKTSHRGQKFAAEQALSCIAERSTIEFNQISKPREEPCKRTTR